MPPDSLAMADMCAESLQRNLIDLTMIETVLRAGR
jgi:hypothetical protein